MLNPLLSFYQGEKMKYNYKKLKKFQKEYFIYGLIVFLLIVYGVMLYSTIDIFSTLSARTRENYELTRGSNFDVIELINSNCADCYDVSSVSTALSQRGASIRSRSIINYETDEGKRLVEKYGITKVPSMIITGEINRTHMTNTLITSVGIAKSDAIILSFFAPYFEVESGKTRGLVSITYITDNSCASCYNVTKHKEILQGYGVKVVNEKYVDISTSEGKNLAKQYNITYIPTIIANNELSYYDDIKNQWSGVGSISSDGSYIFTNKEFMQQLGGNYTEVKV